MTLKELVDAAGKARVTIAGGITEASEVAELDRDVVLVFPLHQIEPGRHVERVVSRRACPRGGHRGVRLSPAQCR